MTTLLRIADLVLNRPLLISRDKAQVILTVLAGRIGVNEPDASRFVGDSAERDQSGRVVGSKPYRVANGVAIITITGSLVNRGAWVGASSGLTSYEGIQHQLKSAMADAGVHAVILDMHSPGGEAVGAFETAALVRQLAAKKRTVAIVNGMACSAAYGIPSGASEIVTTETGVSGSIGVVLLHADFSRQLDRDGITPTLIHAGAHKIDGNPFEPLSADVRSDLQAEVNTLYDAFLATVAKGRGSRLTAAAARKTEARTFIGAAAVQAGLADRVGTFESVLEELSRAGGRSTVQNRRSSMDTNDQPAPHAGVTQAEHDRAVNAAHADGTKAGATAERERFKAVFASEHYRGREAAAQQMLATTDMTAEQITGVLATLPSASPAAAAPAATPEAKPGDGRGPMGISTLSVPAASKTEQVNASDVYRNRQKASAD
ncbi:S49 family peptidase [Klebsiella pneumoniae]